jgi:hypothetical protein
MNPLAAFGAEQIGNVLKSSNFGKGIIDAIQSMAALQKKY